MINGVDQEYLPKLFKIIFKSAEYFKTRADLKLTISSTLWKTVMQYIYIYEQAGGTIPTKYYVKKKCRYEFNKKWN